MTGYISALQFCAQAAYRIITEHMNNTRKHNGYDQTCSYTCQWIIPMTSVRKTSLLFSSVLQSTVPTSVHMEILSIKPDGSMPPEKKSKRLQVSLNELTLKPCKEPIHLD